MFNLDLVLDRTEFLGNSLRNIHRSMSSAVTVEYNTCVRTVVTSCVLYHEDDRPIHFFEATVPVNSFR